MPDVVSVSDVEDRFNVSNTRAQALVDAAESQIENIINTSVFEESFTEEFRGGKPQFIVENPPIKDGSVTITDQSDDSNPQSEDFRVNNDQGLIKHQSRWNRRDVDEYWIVEYTGGLAADQASVPAAMKEAAFIIIENMEGEDNQMKSETIGGYEYTKRDDGFQDAQMLLDQYRVPNV